MPIFSKIKSPRLIKNKKGFTLIELIFEIFVLSILIIPTVLLLGQLSLNIIQTEANSIASDLDVQKAEEIMGLDNYTTVTAGNGVFPSNQNYSYAIGVQCVSIANPDIGVPCESDFKKVTITVSSSNAPSVTTSFLFSRQ